MIEPTDMWPQGELLAHYAAALETILLAMPGSPIVNGEAMKTEDAIADLRTRFDLASNVRAALDRGRKAVTYDRPAD